MAKEIERKYLVEKAFVETLQGGARIKQGYIATKDKTAVRARVKGDKAFLTLKGANKGMTRTEFEYAISVEDAESIIDELCSGGVIDKTRYEVNFSGYIWEVDIFYGENEGLIVAEVELSDENEVFEKPPWLLEEVTNDPRYYNSNLLTNPYSNWEK